MHYNKIIGYSLLAIGLVIIGCTLFTSYKIFTGESKVPELFPVPLVSKTSSNSVNTQDPQKMMEDIIKNQIGDLLPADMLPKTMNLISWSILVGILVLGGGKIAGLGIKLVAVKNSPVS
ncbi:hypothetical protein KJ786_02765 [Patescibacteria group bacterium]|nr:hypothetical protein [Patescibacteria group bacterium]